MAAPTNTLTMDVRLYGPFRIVPVSDRFWLEFRNQGYENTLQCHNLQNAYEKADRILDQYGAAITPTTAR